MKTLWLRHETKPFERRSALTPKAVKILLDRGYHVVVERSPARAYSDDEFERMGAQMVPSNSWKYDAPSDAVILGLKELEDEDMPLTHRHIHFAHVFKGQNGAKETLNRFVQGGGKLYDLEYLVNEKGKRIAAFGYWAGFVGAGLGVIQWAQKQLGASLNDIAPLEESHSSEEFISFVQSHLDKLTIRPRALVIGAKGRCGKGASELLQNLGITPTKWGSKDTKDKGPFKEILEYDILVNCAFMAKRTKPFLTKELLEEEKHLSSISDVGCDPTGPCNPLPIYKDITTMDRPSVTLNYGSSVDVTAIDHLPSLLPRESSDDFCMQLLPHLIEFLKTNIEGTPWGRALEMYFTKCMEYELHKEEALLDIPTKVM